MKKYEQPELTVLQTAVERIMDASAVNNEVEFEVDF